MEQSKYILHLKNVFDKIRESGKKVCLAPMGQVTVNYLNILMGKFGTGGVTVDYIFDNNSNIWGTEYEGIRCISKAELDSIKNDAVILVNGTYYCEIKEQLQSEGFNCLENLHLELAAMGVGEYISEHSDTYLDDIKKIEEICEDERSKKIFRMLTDSWNMENIPDDYFMKIRDDNQYFDSSIIKVSDDEVFVDAGAYVGDTAEKFIEFCGGRFNKAHLFELAPTIYKKLLHNAGKISDMGNGLIQCYPYGLFDSCGTVKFMPGETSSAIADNNISGMMCEGKAMRLDDILQDERITFIKMDIEGSEQSALRGSEGIIKKYKPKLAICIYHSAEDMIKIPLYLKSIVPEYKIYIRHYSNLLYETVCYAVI